MNKCILVGNLTKDPELSTTPSGVDVCKFTLAVKRRFKNAEGAHETDFLPIIAWRETAKNIHHYLKKGSKAGVIGSVQTRTYDAQDGTKRYVTEILADEVEFLTSKSNDDGDESQQAQNTTPKKSTARKTVSELTPVDDDDLPF